jgi:HEAT repeat protein
LFKKKLTPLRIAAIAGLAESTAPNAISAVQALTKDKERDVRDAATKALTPIKGNPAVPDTQRRKW